MYISRYCGKINEHDVNSDVVKQSEIIFLEGYLGMKVNPKSLVSIDSANKVAMSLSDQFVWTVHKSHFLDLVNKLDVTFANEQEMMSLIDAKNFDQVIDFAKSLEKLIVITRRKRISTILGNKVTENDVKKNLEIKDLTGAGDLFAAGFLHGYLHNLSPSECLDKGREMSSKVIQQIGARL